MKNLINFLNTWAQGIILAIVMAGIIEIILPEGNNKKYVKTIIGIYILFILIHPLISKVTNKNIDLESIINKSAGEFNKYKAKNITIETNAYVEETYKKKIDEDIKEKTNEKGYNVIFLDFNIETENEEAYGEIKNINMQIYKKEDSSNNENNVNNKNSVNTIEKVNIKISNNTVNNTDENKINIKEDEIDLFKEYLSTTYSVSKENIHINE